MAIRRSRRSSLRKRKNRRKLFSQDERNSQRNMQIERLEDRCLLAGAQLVGIQPNDGALLEDGDIRNVAPTDLTFRFDENQVIDPASLGDTATPGGIQVTRSDLDGAFAPASLRTDFATGGEVEIEFAAVRLGRDQNGISLTITKSDFGGPGLPGISVLGRNININLNVNADNQTTAADLVNAIGNSVDASNLVTATIVGGTGAPLEAVNIADPSPANTSIVLGDPASLSHPIVTQVHESNDIVVLPGFIGVGEPPALNEVVFRFAGGVPDDTYRIDVFGTGHAPLRNDGNELYLDGEDSNIEFELDLAPQIISVVPQPVLRKTDGSLTQDRDKVVVFFNNDDLFLEVDAFGQPTARSAENPDFYQLIYTSETIENTDDVIVNPIDVAYDAVKDMAVLTFAYDASTDNFLDPSTLTPLGPGTFRLRIGTDETAPAPPIVETPTSEADATFSGVQINFFATGEKWGEAIRIDVIESDHGDDSLPKVDVLDNVITVDLNNNADAGNVNSPNTAGQLVSAINNHFNAGSLVVTSIVTGAPGTAITGTAYDAVRLDGLGSSFDTATQLGDVTGQNRIIRGEIEPQVFALQLPGGNNDPGHREIAVQHIPDDSANHNISYDGDGFVEMGITRLEYNFREDMGVLQDAQGNDQPAFSVITDTQKRRAREAFQILSEVTGVEFVETEREGLIVASGDPATVNLDGQPLVVLDVDLDDRFNSINGWFRNLLSGVSGLLGLGTTAELPGQAIRGSDNDLDPDSLHQDIFGSTVVEPLEPTVLSDHDVVHLQQLYYPESKDIDMFRIQVPEATGSGKLTVETFAERQPQSSLLDTTLSLYRQNDDGSRELLARNDNYFSRDSYVEMDVEPGIYYVGVSAAGNDEYDPTIEDTGFGGTTQGEYDLRFNFQPDVDAAIFDSDNPNDPPTFIDGDADGVPGGVYNFWFRAAPLATTADVTPPFVPARTEPRTFFVDKSVGNGLPATSGTGTIDSPFNNLQVAFGGTTPVGPGDVVRIVGNPGDDGDVTTLDDNRAFQVGFDSLGRPLPDGATMEVPQGVTVMVDSGAIFQMRRARIGVGSSAPGIDRSAGALQVVGAPFLLADNGNDTVDVADSVVEADGQRLSGSAYFTSYNDKEIGLDTNQLGGDPAPGDWGGLLFRDDIDRAQGNFVYDEEGIFLNYVNHADIRYGGGNVLINSVATVANPIHVTDTRPTITFNTITNSSDAAISASPDSFEETNFHAPRHQRIAFTSDYDRIGPDVYGNTLVDNSINGLFVRVATQAGSIAQKLNVSGRWDDTDIVHVVAENLAIASQPGGRLELVTPPPTRLVTQNLATGGSLGTVGVTTEYAYKLVYVDRFGYEGPASLTLPTMTVDPADVAANRQSISLGQLPPASGTFVARRVYRSTNNGPFELVAQLNRMDTTFVDDGTTREGILHVPPVRGVTLTGQLFGTLVEGTYQYRVTYVDSLGKESRPSDATATIAIDGNPNAFGLPGDGTILVDGLPAPHASGNFEARRIYRSVDIGDGNGFGPFELAAEIDDTSSAYVDTGAIDPSVVLDEALVMPRQDGRLSIDPSMVVKLDGARFEIEVGAQMIAEGGDGREIIFSSIADDRFGAGGTFDTGNDGPIVEGGSNEPEAGDWGGIYTGHLSRLNIDHALFAYGGGVTRVEGTFTAFNVVEVHDEAEARIANSIFEFNARGQGGQGEVNRFGRGPNEPGVIFVRQAQPIIYNNVFRNNPDGDPNNLNDSDPTNDITDPNDSVPAININVNALNHELKRDTGRTTGPIDRVEGYRDNQGPLILDNRMERNGLNGMLVRGQTLTTESVWDDTDIVHVVLDTIYVPDFHTFGGLTLASSPTESLVVKLLNDPTGNTQAGFVATGIPHEIDDRIGGIIQIVGQPGSPVVLTSLYDDSHGAGSRPDGDPQVDTNSDETLTSPQPGDWNSVRLDRFSHDRNVELYYESEPRDVNSPGPNGTPDNAQLLGILAPSEYAGDENRRLGFTVKGFLNDSQDVDVYSFEAIPGTEVWIDVDRSTHAFDPVVELLDAQATIVARSNDSPDELKNANNFLEPADRNATNLTSYELNNPNLLVGEARPMLKTPQIPEADFYTTNPRDPGMRLLLPGIPDPNNPDRPLTYHVRVRSGSPNLDDLSGGLTSGAYELQIRLREMQEIGGSTVRFALIGYATNGVELFGQPIHSPLTGESAENTAGNETFAGAPGIGNLLNSDRAAISVAGVLDDGEDGNPFTPDVDFFEFDINYLDAPDDTFETVFDLDYANGLGGRPNASIHVFDTNGRLILTSRDSNVAEDRPSTPGSSDLDDLSRGSVGATDPYIGVIDLSSSRLVAPYTVAVSADRQMPSELDQFFVAQNPTNPDVRLEPIATVRRIAEDHIDFQGGSTADPPQTAVLFDADAAIDYDLGDVVLFLSRDLGVPGDVTSTTILTVDPFTGVQETIVGAFSQETGDVAIHPNGNLYTYRISQNEPIPCVPRDELSGNFYAIDPANASATFITDDNIETYRVDPTDSTKSILSHYCSVTNSQVGDGIEFNAATIWSNQVGFAVGERGFADSPNLIPGVEIAENILYQFDSDPTSPTFGNAISSPESDRVDDTKIPETKYLGAGTQIRERGELLTSPRIEAIYATRATGTSSVSDLRDGDTFTVIDRANRTTFEFDTGPEVQQSISPRTDQSIRDGYFFQLDNNLFQFDTGSVIHFTGGGSAVRGGVVTVNDIQGISRSYEFIFANDPRGDPTATPITIGPATTALQLAGSLAAAVNADAAFVDPAGNRTIRAHAPGTRVSLEGDTLVQVSVGSTGMDVVGDSGAAPILQAVDGSRIVDGEDFYFTSAGNLQQFEFESGYTLHTPVRYMLQLPASGGRAIQDGENFRITNISTGADVIFEFDRDGSTTVTNPDHVIPYLPVETADQIATTIVGVLGNAALNLSLAPTNQGGGLVHLGSTGDNTLDASNAPNLIQTGQASGIGDGEMFTISNGLGTTITFEFDNDNIFVDVNLDTIPDNTLITFNQVDTHDDIADRIATTVSTSGLGLGMPSKGWLPMNIGNGNIWIGGDDGIPVGVGTPIHALDTFSAAPSIGQTGDPGVSDLSVVEIPYIPAVTFTEDMVAEEISNAILAASQSGTTIQALDGDNYSDGQLLIVNDINGTIVLEFDNSRFGPAGVTPGNVPVLFDPGVPAVGNQQAVPPDLASVIAPRINFGINSVANNVTATLGVNARVVVTHYGIDLTTFHPTGSDKVVVNGENIFFSPGTSQILDLTTAVFGVTLIDAEESYDVLASDPVRARYVPPAAGTRNLTDHFIATRVADVVGSHVDYQASGVGGSFSRVNFPDAQTADFIGVPVWTEIASSGSGVASGNERIPLLAHDQPTDHFVDFNLDGTADDLNGSGAGGQTGIPPTGDQADGLARKISEAINTTLSQAFGISATHLGRFVRLNKGSLQNNSGLITTGEGPGGTITGITPMGGTLWAVSDAGGLFQVNGQFSPNATTTYIDTSEDDLLGIQFTGLTTGPPNVEGGRYANMLFATDAAGTVYAFDTAGELQPVFVDGQTSISTGSHPTEVRGIEFSTLDYNLFHVTPSLPYITGATAMDVRLGLAGQVGDAIVVNERQTDPGHELYQFGTSSYAFGQGNVGGTPRSYDFPGGAHGSIVSNEFSLTGYSAADRPSLYFSYWLDTENDSSAPGSANDGIMQDAFRVYISDNNGDWQLLTTNNSHIGPFYVDDELRDYDGIGRTQPDPPDNPIRYFDIQETFDQDDWRQVRVPLDPYAGRENLRLKVDFSTGGDLNVGNEATGDEIRAVAGVFINDGDATVIDNLTIEWDSGLTVVAPTGSAIQTGEEIEITDQLDNKATLQFVDNVLTLSDIIATDGSRLNDGDTFQIDDETTTATFEFDTGYIIEVPAAGGAGIVDQETFVVDFDGAGINPSLTYEFDKNGVFIDVAPPVGPGLEDNAIINIADNLTIVAPAGGGGSIGDQESFNVSDGTTTFTFEFDKNANTIPGRLPVNIIDNWTILLPAAGGGFGGVADGDVFTIDPDGAGIVPALVFEFDSDGISSGDEVIPVDHFTTQDVLADSVVIAINNQDATLGLTAKNIGGGQVSLDGTTILHNLNTTGSPAVGQTRTPLTQDELAERIITALDLADSTPITDGSVLGLTLPRVDFGEVVNGNIILGATTPSHSLDTGGSPGLTQTATPRSAEEIARLIAVAINTDFAGTALAAAALDGGLVNVLDLIGGVIHTVDATGAPGLTLRGEPGVAAGNNPISFLPTDTLDKIIDGGLPIVPGALPRPGLVNAIEDPSIGLDVDAERQAFPNEEIVRLTGTAGNTVTFSPGVTALEPRGVIPIFVDDTQTANDVAAAIALGIEQAVLRGELVAVATHMNGDLGYESPSVPPGEVLINRVNVAGASSIVVNPTSLLTVVGDVGVAVGNLPVPFNTDMNRDEVAATFDGVLEAFYHQPTIITDTGLQFTDGDTFVLDDGLNAPVTYEFDHGYILNIPIGGGMVSAGGISDGESFTITDLSGTIFATFEYDKNGSVMPGSTAIVIKENDSPLGVGKVTTQAIQGHPLRNALGLTPRLLTGNRVQLGGQVGTTLTLTPGGVLTQSQGEPGVNPAVTIGFPPTSQTLGMQLPDPLTVHIPAGGIEDGETFVVDDGQIPPVTFEFEDTAFGDGVTPGNLQVNFSAAASQEEIGRDMVIAIASSGLNVQATMIGGTGNIDLGGGANHVLTLLPGSSLMQTGPLSLQPPTGGGAGIIDGEQFVINVGPLAYVFEFEDDSLSPGDPGYGVSVGSIQINYDPNDSQDVIADLIVLRLETTSGLRDSLDPVKTTGVGRVHLGSVAHDVNPFTNVTVDTSLTHLTQTGRHDQLIDGQLFVISDGAVPVPVTVQFEFDTDGIVNPANAIVDISPGSTPHQIASEIVLEIKNAGLGLDPVNEGDGRIHVGGTSAHQLDTFAIPNISQFGTGGPIPDGQTFIISEAANSVTFEFDKDGTVSGTNIRIDFTDRDSTDAIAQEMITKMSSLWSGLNIFPSYLGDGVINLGGNQNHVVTLTSSLTPMGAMSMQVPQAGGGITGVVDGDTFMVTELATSTDFVFEFDSNGVFVDDVAPFGIPDNTVIPFGFSDTQNDIGHGIVEIVGGVTALGFTPTYGVGGVVNLNGNPLTHTLSFNTTVLTTTGMAGGQTPRVAVAFSPSDDFSAADVAQAIEFSVNNTLALTITASAGAASTADQRRVELSHDIGFPTDITFTPDADGDLRLETPTDVIKQEEDLVRIIGHSVVDPGPLGYDGVVLEDIFTADNNTHLPGDSMGGFHSEGRGQNNRYEGVYLDDFIIGLAERGEEVHDSNNGSTGFTNNPNIALGNTQGEYQLEIRRGPEVDSPLIVPPQTRSFDTNDRQGEGSTIIVQRGLDIADGQTITISDGVEHVVFEYVDTSIPNNQALQGRIAVPFVPSDDDYVIAQRVRDAINSNDAQAVLDVTASLADGTLQGTGSPAPSTSPRVNLFGPVTLEVHATDVEETNDTIADATATRIVGIDSPSFLGAGYIGDNPNFPLHPGFDVDMFQVSLPALPPGEALRVDVDANEIGSDLDPVLTIFDRFGNVVAQNDDAPAPAELPGRWDPFIEFRPTRSGTYYIGVSGFNNLDYDATQEGSGVEGDTGFYQIEITFGASTGNDFVLYDETGDPNRFRDQGQILIHSNTILNSSGFGILAGSGVRDGQDGDIPHSGPVRNTPKMNQDDISPGAVIANNVLAYNVTGGISFSGDPNAIAVGQTASVPFGRIINNTIYGGVGVPVTGGTGPPVTYQGILFPNGDASFADAVVSYDPLAGGGPAPTSNLNPLAATRPPNASSVSLGAGGQIVVEFVDNVLTGSGDASPDLHVFERGADVEDTFVEISSDGVTWFDVGKISGGTSSVDIDAFGYGINDQFPFVRLTDDPNQGDDSVATKGADIDAVGAITTVILTQAVGIGINVVDNASPTILNNIVADLDTGINIDASSTTTVVGGTVYQAITADPPLSSAVPIAEDFPLYLETSDPLFRSSSTGNFYLAAQSPAIDSSIDSLLERFDIEQVKNLIGISDSPILAPNTDVTGQLRVDDPDVETPAGFGENVFTDRGAIDRADFVGPTAQAVNPRDNDADGLDQNPAPTAIELAAGSVLASLRTHMSDGVPPADSALGSGVDDITVITSNITLSRDGVTLVDGIDYSYSYNATSDTIVLTPISGIWQGDSTYVVTVNNTDNFQVVAKPGAELNDGDSFAIRIGFAAAETFEFESGYMMQIPQTLSLQVPAAGGSLGGIPDGATFTIQRVLGAGALQTEVFEFDSNGQFIDNNGDLVPDNHVISYNVASSAEEIAEAIVTQVLISNVGLSPRHVGEGLVHLGSTSVHSVDVSRAPNLTRVGQASGVEDGDSFTVDDGSEIVTFEFDNDGQPADRDLDGQPDNPGAWTDDTIIRFSAAQTHEEIADLVIIAINLADLGLAPTAVGDGVIHLGGTPNVHQVNLSQSNLVLIGEPGVRSAFGIRIPTKAGLPRIVDDGSGLPFITDGDTFTINDGGSSITFEMDNLSAVGGGFTTAPNTVITYRDTSTVDEIADRLVAAIQSAPLVGLTPVNAGNGIVLLGEATDGTSTHTLDGSQTGMDQVGNPGVAAAVPVTFTPHEAFDGGQVAVSMIQSINGSDIDVTARPGGGDVVIIEGATSVSEINPVFVSNTFFGGVKDLAGNDLKPNLLSGETQTTIVLGNANMDFGDAPQSLGGDYPTDLGQNGAIHMIDADPIFLGQRIDADGDGQISDAVDGDDSDSEGWQLDTSGAVNVGQSAAQTPASILLPQPLALVVGDGSQILPGDQFRPGNDGQTVTFEFVNGGLPTVPTNIPITYDGTETMGQIADRVVTAVTSRPELGLSPVNLGDGTVHLGGDSLSVVAIGSGLSSAGTANPIMDEEWFTIDADPGVGTAMYTFEFEDADEDDGVGAGHIPVPFDVSTTQDGYSQAVISAILGARLGIAATDFGDGQVELNGDDDDGVFMGAFNPLTETEIIVTASAVGLLDAWIDFNIDGDFNDAGEQIFASQQLTEGENTFAVKPPLGTVTGTTVGRFRFSTGGGLQPTGLAADGEVEDYEVDILDGNPPQANNDAATFSENEDGTTVAPSVLANDFDADPGDQAILTVASYQTISELGAIVVMDTTANLATKGTFTYDPRGSDILQGLDVNQTLTDTFTYRAKDTMFLSSSGVVTVTITGVNDAPTAVDDVQVFTDQRTAIDVDVLANDNDPENHSLTIINAIGAIGSLSVDTVNNVVNYDPNGMFDHLDQGESDADSFTYQISDGNGGLAIGTVTVTVSGLNDPPVATDDTAPVARTDEDTVNANVDVLANDTDPEGKAITVTAVQTVGTRGLVAVNSAGTTGNTVAYDPNGQFESLAVGQAGADFFKYVVRDADGNSTMGTVTMTIDGVNDNPAASNDTGVSVPRNGTVDIDVLANDTDVDNGDVLQVVAPLDLSSTLGIASINANGTIKYDPNGMFNHLLIGQFAQDRFIYTASDGNGGSSTATVTVTVFGASDPPIAVDDQVTTTEDASVAIGVLFNDTDDFGPMTVTALGQAGLNGSVFISPLNQPNNLVVYSPDGQFDTLAAGQQAIETFTYTVSDGTGSDTGVVTVTVTGVNDAPIANIDANGYTAQRGRTLLAGDRDGSATPGVPGDDGVLLNDTDAEADALTAGLIAGPQHATTNGFTLFADGTFTYTHNGNSATTDTFQYVARDVHNAESQQVVTVVLSIVDAPAAEWQNPIKRFDVNNDGDVSPIDVLLVINYINANLPDLALPTPRPVGAPFYDVNGDGSATGLDVLEIITDINFTNQSQGEGEVYVTAEGESVPASPVIAAPTADIVSPLSDQNGPVVLAEPLSASADHVDEPIRDERPTLASRTVRSERTRDRAEKEKTIRVDPFGVEDALSAIAEEVSGSQAGRTALDDVLEELLS